MTHPDRPDLDPTSVVRSPVTGEAAIDEALAGLNDLGSLPLPEHPDSLARAHERLHQALNRDGS